MAKADIVVFRNQDRKLLVRPSVFIVEHNNGNHRIWIRNDSDVEVQVVIPNDSGNLYETLTPSTQTGGNYKKKIDVPGITQGGTHVINYLVVSNRGEVAQGESAPALIIDD